jgi:hypothetical protein
MKPVTRRSVMAGSAAVVAAFSVTPALGVERDHLLDCLRRYMAEIDTLNASCVEDDEEPNAWLGRANALLAEALKHPVVSTEGALTMLTVALAEPILISNSYCDDKVLQRCREARDFLARGV